MAESFGPVDISNVGNDSGKGAKNIKRRGKKWTRRMVNNRANATVKKKLEIEIGKRQLIGVTVTEGVIKEYGGGEKKRKGQDAERTSQTQRPEVVLEEQHLLAQ